MSEERATYTAGATTQPAHTELNAGDIPKVTPTGLDAGIGISPQTAWLLERIAA